MHNRFVCDVDVAVLIRCPCQGILADARRWIDWDPNPSMRAEVTDLLENNDLDTLRSKFGLVYFSCPYICRY